MEVVAFDCTHSSCFGKSLDVSPQEHLMYFGKRRPKRKSRARSRRKKPTAPSAPSGSTARRSKRKRRRRRRKCYSRSRKSKRSRRRFGSQVAIPRDPEAMPGINNGTWGWNMVNSFYPPGLGGPLGNRVQSLPINYSLS
jgi:hypothetical protein